MEFEQAANAVAENIATEVPATPDPQPDTAPEQNTTVPNDPVPQVTETQAFSRRLNEERDKMVAEIYQGQFKNYAEYRAAVERQQMIDAAQQKGIDPVIYEQMTTAQREAAEAKRIAEESQNALHGYQRREEMTRLDDAMAQHPRYGTFFAANRAEIHEVANRLMPYGTAQEQLEYATKMVLADKYEPPKPVDEASIKATGVKEYLDTINGQNHPTEARGGGIPAANNQIKDPWERARATTMSIINDSNR